MPLIKELALADQAGLELSTAQLLAAFIQDQNSVVIEQGRKKMA